MIRDTAVEEVLIARAVELESLATMLEHQATKLVFSVDERSRVKAGIALPSSLVTHKRLR
jgi:hypothetical protein